MFSITEKANHLHVEPGEKVTLAMILTAIHEVMRHPKYSRLNDLWMFGDAEVFLKQEDLDIIVREIEKVYPRGMQRTRTALVASSGFNQFLAEAFEKIAKNLPYQIEVFSNLPDAEEWLAEGRLKKKEGTA